MKSALLFCCLTVLIAGRAVCSVADAGRVGNVEISAVAWDASLDGIVVKTSGRVFEWDIPAFHRSRPVDYSGDRRLVFFRKGVHEGAPALELLADVSLPEDAKKVLLLFFPARDGRFSVYPIRDDGEDYLPGRARLVNVTPRPLAVKAGGEVFTLAPGDSRLVSGDGRKLSVKLAVEQDGSWRQISSTVLPLGGSQRRSVFFTTTESAYFSRVGIDGEVRRSSPVKLFSIAD